MAVSPANHSPMQAWNPQAARRMPARMPKGLLYIAEALLYMAMYLALGSWTVPVLVSDWFMSQAWYMK